MRQFINTAWSQPSSDGRKNDDIWNGIRFLTDYLQGDVYFKIARENHNLDRCRTQLKLVEDMEAKWDQMQEIVQKVSAEVWNSLGIIEKK